MAILPSVSHHFLLFLYTSNSLLTVAEAEKKGIEEAGGSAEIFQINETLSQEVLAKMHAPPKPSYTLIEPSKLPEFDGFIFGIPTRYGNFPAQWKVNSIDYQALYFLVITFLSPIIYRPSGTPLGSFGLKVPSPASMLVSSFPPPASVAVRRRRSATQSQLSYTMASSTCLWATPPSFPSSRASKPPTVVRPGVLVVSRVLMAHASPRILSLRSRHFRVRISTTSLRRFPSSKSKAP
jgi:hypothetical protein